MQTQTVIYKLWGKVRHGDKRGRTLGYPTANIDLHRSDIAAGVYVATTIVQEKSYESIVFIGPAKTFGNTQWRIESHIFNFDANIYGEYVKVHMHKKIRGNKRFDSIEELVDQIKKDCAAAKAYFIQVGEIQ